MNIKGVMFSSGKCDETVFKERARTMQKNLRPIV